jgi:hypothetical protein
MTTTVIPVVKVFTKEQFEAYMKTEHGYEMIYVDLDQMAWYNRTADYIREEITKVEDWDQLAAFNYIMENKLSVCGFTWKN